MNLPDNPDVIKFLRELFDTNAEFASEHDKEFFAKFHDSQNPKLTILKCSDSRVQMESFDKTPQNDVFAVRNIGNQILTSEGSVDFGVEILNTPFLLIIGHSGCEAVRSAMNGTRTKSEFINKELSNIKVTSTCIKDAIVENINYQVQRALHKYKSRIESGALTVLGAVYDFKNDFGFGHGRVVLTSVNGINDAELVKATYVQRIGNLHFLSRLS